MVTIVNHKTVLIPSKEISNPFIYEIKQETSCCKPKFKLISPPPSWHFLKFMLIIFCCCHMNCEKI
jgi:hypothetical protein